MRGNQFKAVGAAVGIGTGLLISQINYQAQKHKTASVRSHHSNVGRKSATEHVPIKPARRLEDMQVNTANYFSRERQYSLKEIKRSCDNGRIVVGFKGGVFDVTDFTGHPGGYGRLQMAAGNDLEAFWSLYTQHNRGHVEDLLRRYRIGNLSPEDAETLRRTSIPLDNPYKDDPEPKPALLTNTRHPYNAEARLRDLTDSFVTPVERHFVRNHGTVPNVDPRTYSLTVSGLGLRETEFSLAELKAMPSVSVTTVIQCNGNRREDYHFLKDGVPAFGPPHWVAGAVGCSTWTGVRLRDVLAASGMDVDAISTRKADAPPGATSVGVLGLDADECGNQYCCSFPFEKAVDPFGDVILAYQMNGEDIPREHGYPVRCIVPGHAGARNCKFVERVTVTDNPCLDAGNWKQYALHAMDVPLFKLQDFELHKDELKKDPPVQEMPVQSMICVPSAGDVVCSSLQSCPNTQSPVVAAAAKAAASRSEPGASVEVACEGEPRAAAPPPPTPLGRPTVKVRGLAWGGGGEGVNRVDVSADGGKTFTRANLEPKQLERPERRKAEWSWVFFTAEVPLGEEQVQALKGDQPAHLDLVSKALNTSWNVQPESAESNYNAHGCCVNHWYHVPVTVCPRAKHDVPGPAGDFVNKPSGGAFKRPFVHDLPAR